METTVTQVTSPWTPRDPRDIRDPGPIPNYELLGFIKAGGFGDVWLARERVTDVRRAVKVVYKAERERAARDIEGVKRYQGCAHNHPHLLQILTVGETDTCFYYVMEAAGNATSRTDEYEPLTLRTQISAKGRFDAPAALELLAKLAAGVARLHSQGLGHYDLKPENILIVEGEPKIADVGLVAPLDASPPHAGTPVYMTPSGEADDVYALGRILYELLSGRPSGDFPRLPPDLTHQPARELVAAVQIMNRACHPDPARRFRSPLELARAVEAALRPRRDVLTRWRNLSQHGKLTCLVALVATAVAGGWFLHATIPHVDRQYALSLDPRQFKLVGKTTPSVPGATDYLCLRLRGLPLDKAGRYVYPLDRPLRNFLLQCRFSSNRPWGGAWIGLARDQDGMHRVHAYLPGQPDGVGLRTQLEVDGVSSEPPPYIFGHPQPGVEYLLRLARVGDGVKLALWPLVRDSKEPLEVTMKLPHDGFVAHYLMLDCGSGGAQSSLNISELHVWDWSAPLPQVDGDLPADVGQVRQAFVPPLAANAPPLFGNVLGGEFDPCGSDAWMSIGAWSWWGGAVPGQRPKEIRCTPCSSAARLELRQQYAETFEGVQMLRFDRARYADFVATMRVRLRTDPNPKEDDPFVLSSHAGGVGLALRLQDSLHEDDAWGGGYAAVVNVDPDRRQPIIASLQRFDGLRADAKHTSAVAWTGPTRPLGYEPEVKVERTAFFAPDGFTVQIRAVAQHFTLSINNQPVLEADDPGGYASGRIALYASRLIATFDSLDVQALP